MNRARHRRMSMRAAPAAALTIVATATLLLSATAYAQDGELDDLPFGPPQEGSETVTEEGEFQLGDLGVLDEEGNIVWNVEADTQEADLTAEPTPIPESGITGTGSVDTSSNGGGADPAPALDEEPVEVAASSSSNAMFLILAVVGGALVLAVAGAFMFRMRKQRKEELAQVEDVIDPLANEPLAGEFPEPEYAGAAEAGAYEVGGAAYAQYTEGAIGADEMSGSDAPSGRLDQIRASMVDLAEQGLQDSGKAHIVAKKLESAGSKMRPGEWLVMTIAGAVGALFGGAFLLGWLLGAFISVCTAAAFWGYLSMRQSARQKAFGEALPETLQLVSGSLRAGLSMMQAIQTVADEADDPTAEEFHRIVTETRLGRDLAVSFHDLSERMGSKDFEWVVTAIEIHREVGGDLAGILDRVGDTIRARNRVRGQVKALSAEGKMSGLILFVLPPGMVGAISLLNRAYLNEMIDSTEGQIMLIVSAVLLMVGGVWLKRLCRFVY